MFRCAIGACPRPSGASASRRRSTWSGCRRASSTCHRSCPAGQQQRVAIARALAGDPALLLADEPTGNLDSLMARQVMDLLEQINGMGTTIVMVTHDPELARRAHRSVQVIDGQVTDFKPYEPVDGQPRFEATAYA